MRLALERSPELSHRMLQAAFAHASKYVPSRTDCRRLSLYGAYDWREVAARRETAQRCAQTKPARHDGFLFYGPAEWPKVLIQPGSGIVARLSEQMTFGPGG
jgi:hypothetical protein